MSFFMIERYIVLGKELQCSVDDFEEIVINYVAVLKSNNFVKAVSFSHSESEIAVLFGVTE